MGERLGSAPCFTLRRIWAGYLVVCGPVLVAQWVFVDFLGVDGGWRWPVLGVALPLGILLARAEWRTMSPYTAQERRDTKLGLAAFVALIGAIPCFALPTPWSFVAALGWLVLASLALSVLSRYWARPVVGRSSSRAS